MICLFDAVEWSHEQIVSIIRFELSQPYLLADNLRTAAMMCPKAMGSGDFVAAAKDAGINVGTARNRFTETRRFQKEMGEI